MRGISKKTTKKELMEALEKSGGIIADALKLCGMSNTMFFRKYRYDPEVDELLKNLHVLGADVVSQILYQKCLEGNIKAIGLYLKYNPEFKNRGWTDTQTLVLKDDKPLTPEEKKELTKELFG